ncbi:MAG: tRNA (N(6)-L-threonylcarbamoyladenosine(37)-C(2))-methylthiotransferase MtaB [Myxococcota bacterium]
MRVHLAALGCRLNEAELQGWERSLRQSGHQVVHQARQADVCIVNSCAVTAEAESKSRQLARRMHRLNPSAKIVLSGCYASLHPEQAAKTLPVDLLVPNARKDHLVGEVVGKAAEWSGVDSRFRGLPKRSAFCSSEEKPAEHAKMDSRLRGNDKVGGNDKKDQVNKAARGFVKVQDGCRNRCGFCIVTVARGSQRSRPVEDVCSDIRSWQQEGAAEIILTGVHLGGYGGDLGTNLSHLLRAVLRHTTIPRIRLGSLEPWDLPEDFFTLWEQNGRLMPHLHLPLQSGCDSVLARMARRCMTAAYRNLVEQARQSIPNPRITTDVIGGFPGETDSEWQQTMDFVQEMEFGGVHVFPYSKREGTRAASLPDPVPDGVKKERCARLRVLSDRLHRRFAANLQGQVLDVLYECPVAGFTSRDAMNRVSTNTKYSGLDSRPLRGFAPKDPAGVYPRESGGGNDKRGTDDKEKIWWTGYTPNYMRVVTPFTRWSNPGGLIIPTRIDGYDHEQHRCTGIAIPQYRAEQTVSKRREQRLGKAKIFEKAEFIRHSAHE